MEMLNRAYVHALASRAKVNLGPIQEDVYDYGIDGRFILLTTKGGKPQPTGCELHYQLKSTYAWKLNGECIEYKIRRRAFNKMAYQNSRGFNQIVLMLYCLPSDPVDWATFDESQLILRKCCYWYYVGDKELSGADDGKHRLLIPKANLVTPESLGDLIMKLERSEVLS